VWANGNKNLVIELELHEGTISKKNGLYCDLVGTTMALYKTLHRKDRPVLFSISQYSHIVNASRS